MEEKRHGLAQGFDFPATVMPFILRGITLTGIDSVYCPQFRQNAWKRLAEDLDLKHLDSMIKEIGLDDVATAAEDLLNGKSHMNSGGRKYIKSIL